MRTSAGMMDTAGPKACAGTKGTTILVEDLFYNVPLRRKVGSWVHWVHEADVRGNAKGAVPAGAA